MGAQTHVKILSYFATLSLTNDMDRLEWMHDGKKSNVYSTKAIYNLLRVRQQRVPWCYYLLHLGKKNRFRHPSAIIKEIDKTIKLRIAAIRIEDPQFSSSLFQAWPH
ncbi:hypothetical protein HID58_062343 [Brassica napus]|uniref:Uncharacterized protein n=1 Tax=Brassica napus TaxID=3708 RepID=A0ABQ8A172_BRANA|nr:hypothetical protein HID58_062343 [Brassica napus]